ncbi:MAG: hypothetical protein HKN49_04140 [Gammaproteobacteria bacterium]|nr:hypothetical protein [Gammaproteobacteria bacterium]
MNHPTAITVLFSSTVAWCGLVHAADIEIVDIDDIVEGQDYGRWAADWWQRPLSTGANR